MVTHPSQLAKPLHKANFRVFSDYCSNTIYTVFIALVSLFAFELAFGLLFTGIMVATLSTSFGFYWIPLSERFSVYTEKIKHSMKKIDYIMLLVMAINFSISIIFLVFAFSGYSIPISPSLLKQLVQLGVAVGCSFGFLIILYLIVYLKIRKLIKTAIESINS